MTRLRIAGYDGELTPGGQDSSCPYSFEPVDGKSVLTLNNSESNAAKGEMYQFAPDKFASIWASGDLTINIPGSKYDMAINTVTEASSLNPNYYCIYVDGDLTIRGGSDANPKFTMVTSGKNRIWMECAAIYCTGRLTIDCAGTVIAAGTSDVYLHSYGAYAGKGVTVRAGTLTAQSGAICRKGDETGVNGESCAVRSGGGVIVESGALDALGAQTDKGLVNCSSCGVYAGGDVEVKSGTLTARGGGYATYAANNSIGVRAKSVTVRDSGALEATGRLADNESCGILVSGSIRGEGTGTILAKAGETAAVSYGIEYVGDYPDSAMTIALYEGGVLTAQGKTAAIKNSKNDRFTFSVESCRGSESYDGADAAEANEFVPGWRYAVLDGHLSMSVAITEGESMTKLAGDRSFTLHATVTGTSGGTWTWSSSDTSVASVSNAGEVCIRKAGRATITARYVDSSNVGTASLALTVLGTMQKPVVTVSGTKLHWSAQLPDTGKRAMVIAAWYDADGRLLGCGADTLTASGAADGDLTVGAGAAAYRLMIVDATSFAPLCAAAGA